MKNIEPLKIKELEEETRTKVKEFLNDLYGGKTVHEILFISHIVTREIDTSLPKYVDARDLHY